MGEGDSWSRGTQAQGRTEQPQGPRYQAQSQMSQQPPVTGTAGVAAPKDGLVVKPPPPSNRDRETRRGCS